ncbi:hypothetical protein [Dysgonomonas macrotermitis]|uniref:Uncharacterized protein n=1 Tax=Dysgonomonas macrotermitis TaxID=1346286 RepID=A0A1M5ATL1_9BACT|nr:hypothetical protein [Dysgonomonas macrotermitis]SHF33535.1 hypothetical protein SAMN05444362_105155 [Dysgonomonas macrotermitis]
MGALVNLKVGDTLYSVNPQRLVIQRIKIEEIEDGVGSLTSSELSTFGKVKKIIRIALGKFPVEHNQILFFKTENDAEAFIKAQIGL